MYGASEEAPRISRSVPTPSLSVASDAADELALTGAGSSATHTLLISFAGDLASRTHSTGVSPFDPFNQECLLLRDHGLAQWASGEWQLTQHGWHFLANHTDPPAAA